MFLIIYKEYEIKEEKAGLKNTHKELTKWNVVRPQHIWELNLSTTEKNCNSRNAIQLMIFFSFCLYIYLFLIFFFTLSSGSSSDSPKYEGYIHEVCLIRYTLFTGLFPVLSNCNVALVY